MEPASNSSDAIAAVLAERILSGEVAAVAASHNPVIETMFASIGLEDFLRAVLPRDTRS